MNQSTQPPPDPPGWKVLARSDYENIMVARCPGGHIHLNYDNHTVRFQSDKFLTFARMIGEAASRLQGIPWLSPSTPIVFKSSVSFSLN